MMNRFFVYIGIANSKANQKEFVVNVEHSTHEPEFIMCIKTSSLRITKNYPEKCHRCIAPLPPLPCHRGPCHRQRRKVAISHRENSIIEIETF